MTEVEAPPGAAFASLMAGAAESERDPAPYGYTRDRETGEMRPKKTPGRGGRAAVPPPVEALKAPQAAGPVPGDGGDGGPAPGPPPSPPDRAPAEPARRGKAARPDAPAPAYKPGVITKGVNRLYRKAGKIIRALDPDIGEAFIQAARNTADDGELDDSVGAAWEELCRTNPRVRAFVMKWIAGGAVGQLALAHAPIALAIIMKPQVMRFIPFQSAITSMAEPDEDSGPGEGGLPGGMTAADFESVRQLAEQQAAQMGIQVPEHVVKQMAAMANGGVSRETIRNQPRKAGSRADRRGG